MFTVLLNSRCNKLDPFSRVGLKHASLTQDIMKDQQFCAGLNQRSFHTQNKVEKSLIKLMGRPI